VRVRLWDIMVHVNDNILTNKEIEMQLKNRFMLQEFSTCIYFVYHYIAKVTY
jgi:hypothetical protein